MRLPRGRAAGAPAVRADAHAACAAGPALAECPRTPGQPRRGVRVFLALARSDVLAASRRGRPRAARRPPGRFASSSTGTRTCPIARSPTANMISGGLLKIPMEGFSPRRGELTPVVINGGAWQRTITPVQLGRMASESRRTRRGCSRLDQPEDLRRVTASSRSPSKGATGCRSSATGGRVPPRSGASARPAARNRRRSRIGAGD